LLKNLAAPGVEIRHALTKVNAQVSEETHKQQVPWENTNLVGLFYVNPEAAAPIATAIGAAAIAPSGGRRGASPSAPRSAPPRASNEIEIEGTAASSLTFEVDQEAAAPTATANLGATAIAPSGGHPGASPSAPPSASNDIELEFWRSVRNSDKAEEYSAYLTRYPNGNFASIARARLASLQADADARGAGDAQSINTALATRETEEQLGLDQRERSDVQRRLSALGYFGGDPDGNFGDITRRAIERWQLARRYPRSGYFNKLQHDALLAERLPAVRTAAPAAPRPQHQAPAAQQAPPAQQQVPAAQQPAVDPAGAAFMGGIIGGAIGNAIRGR